MHLIIIAIQFLMSDDEENHTCIVRPFVAESDVELSTSDFITSEIDKEDTLVSFSTECLEEPNKKGMAICILCIYML